MSKLKKTNLIIEKKKTFFTFLDLFCFKEIIIGKTKRNFFQLASNIIDHKLSLEFQLSHYSDFEKLKLLILNQEQLDCLKIIPKLNLEKHLNDIIYFRKTTSDINL